MQATVYANLTTRRLTTTLGSSGRHAGLAGSAFAVTEQVDVAPGGFEFVRAGFQQRDHIGDPAGGIERCPANSPVVMEETAASWFGIRPGV